MVTVDDIVRLPCTQDLTGEGIALACRGVSHTFGGGDRRAYGRLQQAAAQAMMELAFRRYLAEHCVPFEVKGAIPFGHPDHYSVVLRRRRCEVRTFLISSQAQALSVRESPGLLLEAPALVPVDEYAEADQSLEDLYIFAFLLGARPSGQAGSGARREAGASSALVYLMPDDWKRPRSWIPLGPLSVKAEGSESIELELGGQAGDRSDTVRSLAVAPRQRQAIEDDYHSVSYVRVSPRPGGRLGIHSPARPETLIIGPRDWRDVWINCEDLYLVGWLTREQYRQRARLIREGSQVFQFDHTRKDNLAVPVSELKPIARLLENPRT